MFRNGHKNVNRQTVYVRHVHGDEINPRFHEAGNEVDVADKPVKLGNDQRCLTLAAERQRLCKFRPVRKFAGFDFNKLTNHFPFFAVQKIRNVSMLCIQPASRLPLPVSGNTKIPNKLTVCHSFILLSALS